MKQALILHGTDATPAHNWFIWMKQCLEERGYVVWLPQLPNSSKPSTEVYNNFLFSNPDFSFDEDTIIIGHSSGAVEILSLLQNLPSEQKIQAAFLVSAFKDWLGWETLSDLFIESLDFENIKQKAERIVFIHSDNDPHCPIEHPQYLASKLNAELIIKEGQGHFNTEISPKYSEFPELLKIIEKNIV